MGCAGNFAVGRNYAGDAGMGDFGEGVTEMGEHKHNPTAIAAKNGELPPKEPKMSKRQQDAWLRKKIQDVTGLPQLVRALGGEYFYV